MPARVANLKGNIGDKVFSMRGKVEESVQDSTYRDRKIIVYIFSCSNVMKYVMIIIKFTFCLFMFIYIMVVFGD